MKKGINKRNKETTEYSDIVNIKHRCLENVQENNQIELETIKRNHINLLE